MMDQMLYEPCSRRTGGTHCKKYDLKETGAALVCRPGERRCMKVRKGDRLRRRERRHSSR